MKLSEEHVDHPQHKGNAEEDLKKADWYLTYAKNMEEKGNEK